MALAACEKEPEPGSASGAPPDPAEAAGDPSPPGAVVKEGLSDALAQLRRLAVSRYAPPSEEEASDYRAWMRHLGGALTERQLPSRPALPGFAAHWVDEGRVWLLAERPERARGAGAVALRAAAQIPLIVEAPHTFFDAQTLPIATAVFEVAGAQALLINTVHRGGVGEDAERKKRARSGDSPADAAHQTRSFFHQAHTELTEVWPRAHVLQIHGFRDEKAPEAKIIVSAAGTETPVVPLARALNAELGPGTARVYPDEISVLGGTTNVQAQESRRNGRSFVHLELAASLRTQLARERSLRERFARAVARGLSVN